MPRRNVAVILGALIVAALCYTRVDHNRYSRVFALAMQIVGRRSLEDVGNDALFEGAMHGMVDALDDPHSSFIAPSDAEDFKQAIDPNFGGLGMEVGVDPATSQLIVNTPMFGAPAYRAGLRAGDRILRIQGQSTQGLSVEDAVRRLRGQPGEPVELSVLHEGATAPVEVTIVRETIKGETVRGDVRRADGSWDYRLKGHEDLGYLRIESFATETAAEMRSALEQLTSKSDDSGRPPLRGLILDLRDNHGGLLQSGIDICDLFLRDGVIVSTRGRDQDEVLDVARATGKAPYAEIPLVVLVNGESASASEIVAACLQDHKRAVVVGERTFGKGTVQEIIDLPDGDGLLRLTTASYWRPSGKNIHRKRDASPADTWGVMPDAGYRVPVTPDEWRAVVAERLRRDSYRLAKLPPADAATPPTDRPLMKAVDYLQRVPGQRPAAVQGAAPSAHAVRSPYRPKIPVAYQIPLLPRFMS